MKILHCCLANFFIDGYSYQENIIPKFNRVDGHTVKILASTETYLERTTLGYTTPGTYLTPEGIEVTRLPYLQTLPFSLVKKLRIYEGVRKQLEDFSPDLIFVHGPQFVDARKITAYAKSNPGVRVVVDNHSDFINSGRSLLSKHVLHKIIYRWCAQKLDEVADTFYGVLPNRVAFLRDVYKVSADKLRFLPLGADLSKIDLDQREAIRQQVRADLKISADKVVLISGGRLDARKKMNELVCATKQLARKNVHLILFGEPVAEMEDQYEEWQSISNVTLPGWLNAEEVYRYLVAADIIVSPATHSVLWEQSTGVGLPGIFKRIPEMEHIDLGGNCLYLETGDCAEIVSLVENIMQSGKLEAMKEVALAKGIAHFSYEKIARSAIA